jgi:hypothetical protein
VIGIDFHFDIIRGKGAMGMTVSGI